MPMRAKWFNGKPPWHQRMVLIESMMNLCLQGYAKPTTPLIAQLVEDAQKADEMAKRLRKSVRKR